MWNLISFLLIFTLGAREISLEEAECLALKYNKELNALIELANVSYERAEEIMSQYFPQAQFVGTYQKSEEKIALLPGYPPQDNFWQTGFQFNQMLFSKELYHQIRAGKLSHQAMEYEVENLKNNLLFQVRSAYWLVVLNLDDIAIQNENISILTQGLDQEEKRAAAGKSAVYQVTQSKVSIANSKATLYTAQKDYKQSLNNLKILIGIDPNEDIVPIDTKIDLCRFQNPFFTDDCYWQELALSYNPDLLRQAFEVNSRKQTVYSHNAEYYPVVSSMASYQQQFIGAPKFTQQRYTWLGGFQLTWNIFDGFGRESRLRQARYRERSSRFDYERIADNLQRETLNQLEEVRESLAILKSSEESLQLSQLALTQAFDRLKVGKVTPLEYRDSTLEHSRAKHNYERSAYNLLRSYYALRRIAGIDIND